MDSDKKTVDGWYSQKLNDVFNLYGNDSAGINYVRPDFYAHFEEGLIAADVEYHELLAEVETLKAQNAALVKAAERAINCITIRTEFDEQMDTLHDLQMAINATKDATP